MATKSSGGINIVIQWSDIKEDSIQSDNTVKDIGSINYSHIYESGNTTGKINEIYHDVAVFPTVGSSKTYNFWAGATGGFLDQTVNIDFKLIQSITIKARGTGPSGYVDVDFDSTSGWNYVFDEVVKVDNSGSLHWNDGASSFTGVAMNAAAQAIVITSRESDNMTAEIVLMGQKR
tara:strand:+ start:6844 stop:7371 length:528 start_codon:yes stop_codon:yes gene_type:complete